MLGPVLQQGLPGAQGTSRKEAAARRGPKQADTRGRRKQCLALPRHGACVSTDGDSGVRFHPNVDEPGMQTGNTFCSRSSPTSGKQAPPGVDHSVDAASPGRAWVSRPGPGSGAAPLSRPPRCPQHTPLTVRWGSHGYHVCTPFPSCHRWVQVSSCAAAAWRPQGVAETGLGWTLPSTAWRFLVQPISVTHSTPARTLRHQAPPERSALTHPRQAREFLVPSEQSTLVSQGLLRVDHRTDRGFSGRYCVQP